MPRPSEKNYQDDDEAGKEFEAGASLDLSPYCPPPRLGVGGEGIFLNWTTVEGLRRLHKGFWQNAGFFVTVIPDNPARKEMQTVSK